MPEVCYWFDNAMCNQIQQQGLPMWQISMTMKWHAFEKHPFNVLDAVQKKTGALHIWNINFQKLPICLQSY